MFGSVGYAEVEGMWREVAAVTGALDADAIALADATRVWEKLDSVERMVSAAKVFVSVRVEESRQWEREGYRSAAEQLAARGGTSTSQAKQGLDTSKKLKKLPKTKAAMKRGDLSPAKASAVADAAAANPDAESKLLDTAKHGSLSETRDECGRAKAAADKDPDATRKRIHDARFLRLFGDSEGGWNAVIRGTREDGARLQRWLQPLLDERFKQARLSGERASHETYAYDALFALLHSIDTDPPTKSTGAVRAKYLTLVRVDLEALLRGNVGDGELCEINGIGPIPIERARELLGESVLKLILTKGVDVANVTHLGRGPNAAQRVALLWRSPRCSVEGCDRIHTENDHRVPYAQTLHTRLDELDPLCGHHHDLKTHEGWALVTGKGRRAFVAPEDPRHPSRDRPPERDHPAPAAKPQAEPLDLEYAPA
jgi:hypothetical protein